MARVGKLIRPLLLSLLVGGAIYLTLSSPAGSRKLFKAIGYEIKRREARKWFFWSIAYLRRKKYIDYRVAKDGKVTITLTEDGRKKALHYKLDDISLPKTKRWDGKWRIIAFDIPETKKSGRDALRMKMKELGLLQLQKSLWAWPHECRDEIDFIAEVFNIGQYVHYMVAESLTSDKFLKYKFNLA